MKTALLIIVPIILLAILSPFIFYIGLTLWGDWHDEWSGFNASSYIGDGHCNIAVLPVLGAVHTYGAIYDDYGGELVSTNMSDALSFLSRAETEPGILGVMALIDTPGGSAAAAELIAAELKKSAMPNAAFIADSGTSAGYLIASAADTIIASPFSNVGSIGVTMSYLDYSRQNTEQGIDYVSLASGKFKDYGAPDRPLTDEERALFERDLTIWHDEFVRQVAINRNLPIEDVAALADGSSMPGALALEAKLIDAVGDRDLVREWFAQQLGMSAEEVVFCE